MATRKKQQGKLSGLTADGTPNAYWRRFKERLEAYEDTPVADWKEEHMLGHILKRYKDVMEVDFALSYSGPPTKCKEIYCIRRTILALGADDGPTVKQYIDWVFDTKILPQKMTISSIAFFFTTNLVLTFKKEMRRQNRVSRASELPEAYRNVVAALSLDVKTYGDLAFAKVALEDDPNNEDLKAYSDLFGKLKENGFDESVLKSLEG
jgi:hypothetical protein